MDNKPSQVLQPEVKKYLVAGAAKGLINAMQTDMYPYEQIEAIFGIKMEQKNPHEVKNMTIGTIVFNVWVGLYKNGMVDMKWLEKTLLDGNLPK